MSLLSIPAKDIWKYTQEKSAVLIDLRSNEEFKRGHIPGAINVSYKEIFQYVKTLNKEQSLILYCERGNISLQLGRKLSRSGIHIINIYGGINAYRGKLSVDE